VRTRILPGHELASLNAEARAVVIMIAATRMRPNEAVGIIAGRIVHEAGLSDLLSAATLAGTLPSRSDSVFAQYSPVTMHNVAV
jgi:hypothetical protein